jgi:hypothetical protein
MNDTDERRGETYGRLAESLDRIEAVLVSTATRVDNIERNLTLGKGAFVGVAFAAVTFGGVMGERLAKFIALLFP